MRLNQQGLEQQGPGEHELDQQGQLDNIPLVYQVPVNTDEHAEEHQEEHQENNKEPQQENMEEQNRKEIEMEVDKEDQEKTENSLNLNLSSVSDAENEGTIDDGRQQVVDNGKKRFNLFEKPPKENCVQAI